MSELSEDERAARRRRVGSADNLDTLDFAMAPGCVLAQLGGLVSSVAWYSERYEHLRWKHWPSVLAWNVAIGYRLRPIQCARCWMTIGQDPRMLTADTISDEQIRALQNAANTCNEMSCLTCHETWQVTCTALGGDNHDGDRISPEGIAVRIKQARARCAAILNAR